MKLGEQKENRMEVKMEERYQSCFIKNILKYRKKAI